jgi:bifunctional UDP-N-acetylglucosamine pyrophosphorylase/glucosamine-1-phosphate N-acetyltransferase
LALLTAEFDTPDGYGRIVRDSAGRVQRIVEQPDATPEELALREINTGFLVAPARLLRRWLARLRADNRQGEYYLTDVIAMAVNDGLEVVTVPAANPEEVLGVNSKAQLAALERVHQRAVAATLLAAGVTLADPARIDVRGELHAGRDVSIDIDTLFEGRVVLGDRVRIGPFCVLRDVQVADDAVIHAHSLLDGAEVGVGCQIGPFARLRPETRLDSGARVGNFVEIKKSSVGCGSKINHLSYIGDAEIGRDVNIGAGTITCNYDGHNKHRTRIGDAAFIGSDTQLVAPVTVGDGATVGAGTTITRDVPPGGLTLSRTPQQTLPKWRRPGSAGEPEREPG